MIRPMPTPLLWSANCPLLFYDPPTAHSSSLWVTWESPRIPTLGPWGFPGTSFGFPSRSPIWTVQRGPNPVGSWRTLLPVRRSHWIHCGSSFGAVDCPLGHPRDPGGDRARDPGRTRVGVPNGPIWTIHRTDLEIKWYLQIGSHLDGPIWTSWTVQFGSHLDGPIWTSWTVRFGSHLDGPI